MYNLRLDGIRYQKRLWNYILEAIKQKYSPLEEFTYRRVQTTKLDFFEHENEQNMYMETLYTYPHTQTLKKSTKIFIWEQTRRKHSRFFALFCFNKTRH